MALLAILLVDHVPKCRFRQAAWDAGRFVGIFLLFWVLAGQNPRNIPAFVTAMCRYSADYSEAMSMYRPNEVFLVGLGIAVFVMVAVANGLRAWQFAKYRFRIPLTLFECACLFIIWKHGYVRIDHAANFWTLIVQATPLLFLAHEGFPAGRAAAAAAAWLSARRRRAACRRIAAAGAGRADVAGGRVAVLAFGRGRDGEGIVRRGVGGSPCREERCCRGQIPRAPAAAIEPLAASTSLRPGEKGCALSYSLNVALPWRSRCGRFGDLRYGTVG